MMKMLFFIVEEVSHDCNIIIMSYMYSQLLEVFEKLSSAKQWVGGGSFSEIPASHAPLNIKFSCFIHFRNFVLAQFT